MLIVVKILPIKMKMETTMENNGCANLLFSAIKYYRHGEYAKRNVWLYSRPLVIKFHVNLIDICEKPSKHWKLHSIWLHICMTFVLLQMLFERNKSPSDRCSHRFQWSAKAVLRDLIFFVCFGFFYAASSHYLIVYAIVFLVGENTFITSHPSPTTHSYTKNRYSPMDPVNNILRIHFRDTSMYVIILLVECDCRYSFVYT